MTNRYEIKNYLRQLRSPLFFCRAAVSLIHAVKWAFLRRLSPEWVRLNSLPFAISELRSKSLCKLQTHSYENYPIEPIDVKLKLASGWMHYKSSSDWSVEFRDIEVTTSLHRWGWLLRGITDQDNFLNHNQGVLLIRSWLRSCLSNDLLGSDPYSASERIVNASIFFLYHGNSEFPDDILFAFSIMARQIALNLEYYDGKKTGNHALNNARGLFFAGVLLNKSDTIALAYAIFQERLPYLVTADGFLREGSSHYHFLFTRWILEIHWFAVLYGQDEIAKFIFQFARSLVERCWFFLVRDDVTGTWSIPLIGDISPDFPPNWLVAIPWSRQALSVYRPKIFPIFKGSAGWASLFGFESGYDEISPVEQSLTFPKSFWHRIVRDEFTLFIHTEATDGTIRADHRHFDLGGFVLYRFGFLVFADSGRIDYTLSKLSKYGKSSASHSTIFIDGLSPAADCPHWFHKLYMTVDVNTEFCESDKSSIFILQHNGFRRAGKNALSHERNFILSHNSFQIEDCLNGTETHNVKLRFHFSPGLTMVNSNYSTWSLMPGNAIFVADKRLHGTNIIDHERDPMGGIYSREYSLSEECLTLELAGELKFPTKIINSMIWN